MKKHWDELVESLSGFEDMVSEFGQKAKLSHADYKKFMSIRTAWEACRKAINSFDTFVSPVASIAVKFPSIDKDFLEVWGFYKEYMQEQHAVTMRSRYEIKALDLLWKMAEEKPDKAAEILNYSMGKGYKGFFAPTENTIVETPKTVQHDPDLN